MKKRMMALVFLGVMVFGTAAQVQAGRIVKPIDEQLAEREVLTTPQEKHIRLGEEGKPRVIITSDLEVDDMNSFIHQSLFFNEIDLAGIVVSGSFCHFTGDSGSIIGLYSCGLRGLENGAFGSYGGRYSYTKANGEDAGYLSTLSGGVVPTQYVNPETNNIEKYNPFLLDFQLEWAARADWCVNTYENCNHAPVVEMEEKDFTAAPGETVSFAATVSDPDGDDCTAVWTTEPTGCVYSGKDETIYNWTQDSAEGSFTIPEDAASGDCFCLTLRVQDNADAVMTRYAQVMVTVA